MYFIHGFWEKESELYPEASVAVQESFHYVDRKQKKRMKEGSTH